MENNRIVKVKGDKSNVRSEGYVCRKGMNIANHQHNADRLKYPLKRVGNTFERISWEQAIDEIGAKLKEIVEQYGPRSFAYMGGGGQGCHFEAAFGVRLMRGLGSRYHYSPLTQEFSGMFWVFGRMFGRQNVHAGDRCGGDGFPPGLRLERDAEPPDPPGPEAAPADREGSGQDSSSSSIRASPRRRRSPTSICPSARERMPSSCGP